MDTQCEDWLVHGDFLILLLQWTVKVIVIIVKFQISTTSYTCK